MIQPMRATDYYGQPIKGWLLSEKMDGVRARWTGTELQTCTGKRIDCPDYITASFPSFAIEGELWAGRGGFQRVLSALKGGNWSGVRFVAFDAICEGATAMERQIMLGNCSTIETAAQQVISGKREMKRIAKQIIDGGGEGVILRNPASLYVAGKSDDYARVKPVICNEATVIGAVATSGGRVSLLCEFNGESFRLHTSNADNEGHCISLSGSIQLEQSVIRIKGHGERIANAYADGYYFLETDTDGPFIDTVHESFVESNRENTH